MSQIEYNFALKLYDVYSKYLGTYKINTIFIYLGIFCTDKDTYLKNCNLIVT